MPPELWLARALAHKIRGDAAAALADCTEALARAPDWAPALFERGILRERLGDLAGAIADFERVGRLDPHHAEAAERLRAARARADSAPAPGAPEGEGWVTHRVALAPDGERTVRGRMHAERGTARLVLRDGEAEHAVAHGGPVRDIAWRPDGQAVAATDDHRGVVVLAVPDLTVQARFGGHTRWVRSVAWSGDGARIASGGADGVLCVRAAAGGALAWRVDDLDDVTALAFAGSDRLVGFAAGGRLHIWDAGTGTAIALGGPAAPACLALAIAPDGATAASGHWDGTVRRWRVADGAPLGEPIPAGGRVRALAHSPDGRRLAASADGPRLRVWEIDTGRPVAAPEPSRSLGALRFTGDGAALLGADYDGAGHRVVLAPR